MSEVANIEDFSPRYVVSMVPASRCPFVWRDVYNMLLPAVERANGRWTMDHLLMALCTGNHTLWIAHDRDGNIKAALTTQLVNYPNGRWLAFQFLGGDDFDSWSDDMLELLEKYAEDMGCDGIESSARFGFWPFFKRRGYKRSCASYIKVME